MDTSKKIAKPMYAQLKTLLVLFAVLLTSIAVSQTTYESIVKTKYSQPKGETVEQDHSIVFSENFVVITDWKFDGSSLKLKINRVEEKDDELILAISRGTKKWYYCSSVEASAVTGEFYEYILVMDKLNPRDLLVFQKADEVTYLPTKLYWP